MAYGAIITSLSDFFFLPIDHLNKQREEHMS